MPKQALELGSGLDQPTDEKEGSLTRKREMGRD